MKLIILFKRIVVLRYFSKVWDAVSGACITTLPHNHIVRTVDISASNNQVLSGGSEKKMRLWDLTRAPSDGSDASATDGVVEFVGVDGLTHAGTVRSALFDEKRNTVVSQGEDMTVK